MRRLAIFIIAVLTMATVNAKILTERQKGLAACACLMAQGDLDRLEPAVKMALDNGVTINELKEAFSQLYAYTGFPRSLNALGVLSKVLENKQTNWQEGKPWTRPAEWDDAKAAYELGKKNQIQLSGRAFDYEFCPQDDYYLKAHLFGDTFETTQCCYGHYLAVGSCKLVASEDIAKEMSLQIVVILRTEVIVERTTRELCLHLSALFQCLCCVIPNLWARPRLALLPLRLPVLQYLTQYT